MNLVELQKENLPIDTQAIDDWYPGGFEDDFEYGETIKEYFKKLGFKLLGTGAFGAVFGHPKLNYVIKFFKDKSYLEYIEFCKKNSSPHLPKFRGKLMKSKKYPNINAIRIEKLSIIPSDIINGYLDIITPLFTSKLKFRTKFKSLNGIIQEQNMTEYFTEDLYNILSRLYTIHPNRVDFYNPNNIMFRETDKKIVITDPWG